MFFVYMCLFCAYVYCIMGLLVKKWTLHVLNVVRKGALVN